MEIVRAGFIASSSGDPAAAHAFYDPTVEWDMTGVVGWAEKDVYRGAEEVLPFLQGWANSWRDWHFDIDEVRDAGDWVVVPVRLIGRGRTSGAPFHEQEVHVFRLRDEKITEFREYREMSEALKAVGPEE